MNERDELAQEAYSSSKEETERYTVWFFRRQVLGEGVERIASHDELGKPRSEAITVEVIERGIAIADYLLSAFPDVPTSELMQLTPEETKKYKWQTGYVSRQKKRPGWGKP